MHCLQGSVEGPQERTQIHVQSPYSPQQAHVPQPEQPPRPADTMAEKKKTTAGSSRSLRVCHEQEQELHVAARTTQRLKPSQKHTPSPHGPDRLHTLGAHPRRQQRRRSRRKRKKMSSGTRLGQGLHDATSFEGSSQSENHQSPTPKNNAISCVQNNGSCAAISGTTHALPKGSYNNGFSVWQPHPSQKAPPIPSFTWVMESMGWKYEHLGWFHYRSPHNPLDDRHHSNSGRLRRTTQDRHPALPTRRTSMHAVQLLRPPLHDVRTALHPRPPHSRLRLLQPHREGVGRHRVLASVKEHDTLTAQTAKSDRDIRREAKESRAAQPKKKKATARSSKMSHILLLQARTQCLTSRRSS